MQQFDDTQGATGFTTESTDDPFMEARILSHFLSNPLGQFKIFVFVLKFNFRQNNAGKSPVVNIDEPDVSCMLDFVSGFLENVLATYTSKHLLSVRSRDFIFVFQAART
jgi:hypothetical protein